MPEFTMIPFLFWGSPCRRVQVTLLFSKLRWFLFVLEIKDFNQFSGHVWKGEWGRGNCLTCLILNPPLRLWPYCFRVVGCRAIRSENTPHIGLILGQGSLSGDSSSSSMLTLVFFIGGVTYAEISALRFLSRQNDGNEYVIATTAIVNGNSLLQPLIED